MPMRNADKELTDTAQRVGRMAFYGEVAEIDSYSHSFRRYSDGLAALWSGSRRRGQNMVCTGTGRAGYGRMSEWRCESGMRRLFIVSRTTFCPGRRYQHHAAGLEGWNCPRIRQGKTPLDTPSGTFRVEVGSSLFELTGDKLILKASRVDLAPKE
jgi:hypothetical protein